MKKVVMITGALGQDGRIITNILYKSKNFKIIGTDYKKNVINKKIKIFKINLFNKNIVKKFISTHNPKYLIHLASSNYSHNFKRKPVFNKEYLDNFTISKNLIDAIVSLNLKTIFIFAGSARMYEGYNEKIINENTRFKPVNYYSRYKVDVHKYFMWLKKGKKINGTTVILFNHDSIFRNKKFLIPRLINYFINRKLSLIRNIYKSNIIGDFSHAADICYGIYSLMLKRKYPDKIIFSSFKKTYVNDIVLFINKYYNYKINFDKISKSQKILIGDNSLAKKYIKYKPKLNIYHVVNELIKSNSKLLNHR
jgi:GDPmannose 4,6-dehydratase